MWGMQENILKPNVIFFLKYRNRKNKELLQKYVHSGNLAEWRVNSARQSLSSFSFEVIFIVNVTPLYCVFFILWRRELNKLYWCVKVTIIPDSAKESTFLSWYTIVIIWNNFVLQFCITNGPDFWGRRVALAGPLGVSLARRESKHSKQEKAKDLQAPTMAEGAVWSDHINFYWK